MASLAKPMGQKKAQDRQMEKLQQQLRALEKQNSEQTMLVERLEQLSRMETERTQRALERASSSHRTLQDEIDRVYGPTHDASPRSTNNKVVEEIIAKRTQDFQRSQAEKALNMKLLVQERLKIQEARDRLRAKQELHRSLPSPIGKATQRSWGHKYSIYTPMLQDDRLGTYTPVFQDGYYTYFPRTKRRQQWFNSKIKFVPVPLFESLNY